METETTLEINDHRIIRRLCYYYDHENFDTYCCTTNSQDSQHTVRLGVR